MIVITTEKIEFIAVTLMSNTQRELSVITNRKYICTRDRVCYSEVARGLSSDTCKLGLILELYIP